MSISPGAGHVSLASPGLLQQGAHLQAQWSGLFHITVCPPIVASPSGQVCHHGTAGGGHYTCYNYNPTSGAWFEFDDSIVRQVDLATVLASEAYVLFYRKASQGETWQ